MTAIVVCAPDLMDQSKIRAAADASGREIAFVRVPHLVGAVVDDAGVELVVVDLSRAGVIDAVAAIAAERAGTSRSLRIVGFGSHVDRTLLDAARDGGCDAVMARSAFFGDVAGVLVPQDGTIAAPVQEKDGKGSGGRDK